MAKAAAKDVKEPLNLERIEIAALELIEEEGFEAFSTRKLAGCLGCEAMSIYHYFPSKGRLLDALVDRVVADELSVLDPAAGPWRVQLENVAEEYRQMALRHPAFFPYLAPHRFNTPTALRWLNGVIGVMTHLGLPQETGVRLFRALGYYINGASLDEAAGYSRGPSTVVPVASEVMARDYPEVVAAAPWFAEAERKKTFELGLRILLDGIAAEVERGAAKRRASGR
jgi:AcrR family transcriptional regulator